jgi:hypothetical protein
MSAVTSAAERSVTLIDHGQPITWRRSAAVRVLTMLLAVAAIVAAIAFVRAYGASDLWVPAMLIGFSLAIFQWCRASITLDQRDVTVVGAFRQRTVPLAQVGSAESW